MSTENITDAAQTTQPASNAGAAPHAQGAAETTLKNGWGGTAPTASEPAAAEKSAPAAPEQAAPAPSAAPDVAPATAAAVEGSVPTPAPTGNREQLHRRVESRLQELEAARAQLAGQDGNQARARAIETELQVARDAMQGGWEHVGPIEAAHLSQWLTNTGDLIVAKPAAEA